MIELLILLIPAGIGNMLPPLFAHIREDWNWPVDMGKTFRGRRILGDHKTFKGFVVGMVGGQLSFWILQAFGLILTPLPWYTGALLGFSALGADAIKSFFKRQGDVAPGKSWFPWDQLDWVLGGLFYIATFKQIVWWQAAATIGIGLTTHLFVKVIGYVAKINDTAI